jgi:hypothetical protein
MNEMLTRKEMEVQFHGEWVLLGDVQSKPGQSIQAGRVLWHSKDRDEVYDKLLELRPPSAAALCLCEDDENSEFLL